MTETETAKTANSAMAIFLALARFLFLPDPTENDPSPLLETRARLPVPALMAFPTA